jgi:hypothetical protein
MFGIIGDDDISTLRLLATIVAGQSERQWDADHIRVSRKHQCISSTAVLINCYC